MTAEEAAIEDLIAEVLRRKDGETTRYVAEKARAVARAARVEALRGAERKAGPWMKAKGFGGVARVSISLWLAARAEEEDRG